MMMVLLLSDTDKRSKSLMDIIPANPRTESMIEFDVDDDLEDCGPYSGS